MTVYLDIAFLINLLFDAEIIILALAVAHKKIVYKRLFFAAFIGGMQGVFVFFPYFRMLSLPPVSLITAAFMVYVAGNPKSTRDFFEMYIFFLTSAFLFGGIMSFLGLRAVFGLLLIFPIYLLILKIRKRVFKRYTDITLHYNGRKIEKKAVYDSCNSVFYLGKPVIFANKSLVCEFFGENDEMIKELNPDDFCKVRYKSVGNGGILTGLRLEKAVVSGKNYDGAILCFFGGKLKDEVILNSIMI